MTDQEWKDAAELLQRRLTHVTDAAPPLVNTRTGHRPMGTPQAPAQLDEAIPPRARESIQDELEELDKLLDRFRARNPLVAKLANHLKEAVKDVGAGVRPKRQLALVDDVGTDLADIINRSLVAEEDERVI